MALGVKIAEMKSLSQILVSLLRVFEVSHHPAVRSLVSDNYSGVYYSSPAVWHFLPIFILKSATGQIVFTQRRSHAESGQEI